MMPAVKTRPSLADRLRSRLAAKTATVGVVGLGYVGLPLAETFACGRFPRPAASTSMTNKSPRSTRRELHRPYLRRHASPNCSAATASTPPADPAVFVEADAIVICVPTPLTEAREPDLSYVDNDRPKARSSSASRAN